MTIYFACFQYIQLKYKFFKGDVLGNLISHPENVFIDYIIIIAQLNTLWYSKA